MSAGLYTPFDFEGQRLPGAGELAGALTDPARRPWLVRAAVSTPALADALSPRCAELFGAPDHQHRAAGFHTARALYLRPLLTPLAEAMLAHPDQWYGVADPLEPGQTLAGAALAWMALIRPRGHRLSREVLRAALDDPDLGISAWRALCVEDAEGPLPHLKALIERHPELASEVGTHYALVHTDWCEPLALALAELPDAPRQALTQALRKHLDRIHSIKLWVACRKALTGR